MKVTKTEKLMLYALSEFYHRLNQPLEKTPLEINTSKIIFIELLLQTQTILKKERAIYKNLEALERKKLISYEHKIIKFTDQGILQLKKIQRELQPFMEIKNSF